MNDEIISVIPADALVTVREQAILAIIASCEQMKQFSTGNVDVGPLWNTVLRGDPDDNDIPVLKAPAVCIEDGEDTIVGEQTMHSYNVVSREMVVYVHVRFNPSQQGVDPFSLFNYYLGRLQQTLLADYLFGGIIHDLRETASAPQIFKRDRLQGGFLALSCRYRHHRNNPYKAV